MTYISPVSSYANRNYSLDNKQVGQYNNLPQITSKSNKFKPQITNMSKIKKVAKFGAIFSLIISIEHLIRTNKKRALNSIPKDLQTKFEKIKDLKGKEFVNKAYEELVNYMKLDGIAPKNINANLAFTTKAITNEKTSINGALIAILVII